jgi:hypothetical protein
MDRQPLPKQRYLRLVETDVNVELRLEPRLLTAATMAIDKVPAIIAYSMAVAAVRSSRNRWNCWIMCIAASSLRSSDLGFGSNRSIAASRLGLLLNLALFVFNARAAEGDGPAGS